jgi:hypothetical protein
MSKLSDLRNKGKAVTLSNGEVITLKPMTLDEEVSIAEFQEKNEFVKAMSYLVKNALKRAIPDATDDEINDINKEDLKVITEAIMELNGLKSSKNDEAKKE